MAYDFYEHTAESTAELLKRMAVYVDMAIANGDSIHQEKPGQLIINIRLPKKEKE